MNDIYDTNDYPEDPWTRVAKLEQQAEERDAVIKRLKELLRETITPVFISADLHDRITQALQENK